MIAAILHAFVLFGAGLAWVLALGQLALRAKQPANYLLAVFLVLLGCWQALGGLVFSGRTASWPFSVYIISVPVFFLSVPFFYFYLQSVIKADYRFRPRQLLHLALPVAAALVLLPHARRPLDLYAVMGLAHHGGLRGNELAVSAVMYLAMVVYSGYLVACLRDVFRLISQMEVERELTLRLALGAVGFFIALNLFWFADRILSLGLPEVPYVCVSLTMILMYLAGIRQPEYLLMIKAEAGRVRYANSQVAGLDVDGLAGRLDRVMRDERAYQDKDLTLAWLATRLGISAHQLSELINQRLGTNFYGLVNGYRIEEARRLLRLEPERKIIAIAYEVGFNSPSAFYNAFKKATGQTPSAFRNSPESA